MKKIKILIPIYNDWESLIKLLDQINESINEFNQIEVECIIINDASTRSAPILTKPGNIKLLKVMNMIENKGHARCNAFGIRYLILNEKFDYLILMDGDGEDRPVEIKSFLNEISTKPSNSIVAKRVKRSEGLFFKLLYQMHKIITYIFTGKKINFGNYSCLTKKDVEQISSKASLWSSYSGTVKKYIKNLNEINSTRGLRYFGPSKMSLLNLILHSFSIIAVFKYQVFFRSLIFLFVLEYLSNILDVNLILIQILLIIFCIIIFAVSFREKEDELQNSQENLKSVNVITQ